MVLQDDLVYLQYSTSFSEQIPFNVSKSKVIIFIKAFVGGDGVEGEGIG